jgi:hypothetical protein
MNYTKFDEHSLSIKDYLLAVVLLWPLLFLVLVFFRSIRSPSVVWQYYMTLLITIFLPLLFFFLFLCSLEFYLLLLHLLKLLNNSSIKILLNLIDQLCLILYKSLLGGLHGLN